MPHDVNSLPLAAGADTPLLAGDPLFADAPQSVRFAAGSLSVSRVEGNSGFSTFTFTVERVGGSVGSVVALGSFRLGTTTAADFGGTLPGPFSVTFAAGATTATVTIQVSGDLAPEALEQFTLRLETVQSDSGVVVSIDPAGATATGSILNDDDPGAFVGGVRVLPEAPSLQGSAAVPTATDAIVLTRLGSFNGTGTTAAGRSESVAYDAATGRLFTTNAAADRIDVTQINADGSATAVSSIQLSPLPGYGEVNSVAVRNGVVAIAVQNAAGDVAGVVALYSAATGALIKTITVGVLPDQLVFTPDGTRLLVANEAEPISSTVNAPGSISIIDMSGGAAAATVISTVSFASLANEEAVLRARGLALFPGQSAANDIEPEYIAVSADGTRAYVTLQEVNAVAVLDLTNPALTAPIAIQPLGFIDRSLAGNQFDPNDQNGINLANFPVRSLLQPDAIATFSVGGITYFVTANEGDARVGTGLLDEARLGASSYVLDPATFPNAAALKTNAQLGRLNVVTSIGDTDGDRDIDQIYTFGGRGISIFRQNADGTITKVRETGGEFERIIAATRPDLFNTENLADPDNRSDNKGPEPEGVAIGVVGGRTYAFVTLERVGGVMIYDVTDPANATFVGFRPVTSQDFAPETLVFIPAAQSPTGQALVVTANEVSGTTTIYAVNSQSDGADFLRGGAEADSLSGRGGADRVYGGAGADRLDGGADADIVNGEAGDDGLFGGAGADTLSGEVGNDVLNGESGADVLIGGAGNDVLSGEADNDILVGEAGADQLIGGSGADQFVFVQVGDSAPTAADLIVDFTRGQDVIDLSRIDANSGVAGDQAVAFVGAFSGVAGQATLSFDATSNRTTLSLDVNGDRVADMVLVIVGNVGPNDGFVL